MIPLITSQLPGLFNVENQGLLRFAPFKFDYLSGIAGIVVIEVGI